MPDLMCYFLKCWLIFTSLTYSVQCNLQAWEAGIISANLTDMALSPLTWFSTWILPLPWPLLPSPLTFKWVDYMYYSVHISLIAFVLFLYWGLFSCLLRANALARVHIHVGTSLIIKTYHMQVQHWSQLASFCCGLISILPRAPSSSTHWLPALLPWSGKITLQICKNTLLIFHEACQTAPLDKHSFHFFSFHFSFFISCSAPETPPAP